MNLPVGYREDMTDAELVEAWVAGGMPRRQAEVKMRMLRHNKGKPVR